MKLKLLFLLVLSINIVIEFVHSDQILPTHTGGTFSRSSNEPKYRIEFHTQESPFHPEDDQESMVMNNKNGEKHLCFLPKLEKSKSKISFNHQNTSSLIIESEQRLKMKTPDELLEVLKDRCFIRQEGWWSYEFCYQKKMRQIHLEDEKVVQEFILGEYDADVTAAYNENLSDISTLKDPRSKDASQRYELKLDKNESSYRYHAHQYTNGTICDLSGQPRETEVRFVCSEPRAMISSISELSTCKYAVTIQCPTLCKHPLFQEERPVWHTINCNVLPEDHKEPKTEERNDRDEKISMVTDPKYPPAFDAEDQAT